MTNNTSDREKEIKEISNHFFPCQEPGKCAFDKLSGYDYSCKKCVQMGAFCFGMQTADDNPAPTGKVLSDEDARQFELCKRHYKNGHLGNLGIEFLIDLVTRLTEQKPVCGGD